MKPLVVLAIAVRMISVHGSSIDEEVLEHDDALYNDHHYCSVEGRDESICGKIEDELYDRETLSDDSLVRREVSHKCLNNACSVCQGINCLHLVYLAEEKNFFLAFTKYTIQLNKEIFKAMDWEKCMQLENWHEFSGSCVKIQNVRIDYSRACVDLTIDAMFVSQSFSDMCMQKGNYM